MGLSQEKAETISFKKRLRAEILKADENCGERALGIFRDEMKRRPDIMLPASDLSGDLEDMFRVIYILSMEQRKEPDKSMLRISRDINELIKHYRVIRMIEENMKNNVASEEEIAYYQDAGVSEAMRDQIRHML